MTSTRRGFTLVELVVVVLILLVLLALLLPAVHRGREAARRSQCKNNLKLIGLALHSYHETYQSLPSGWTSGDDFSWSSRILPQLDQARLYAQLNFGKPWTTDPASAETVLPVFRCPNDTGDVVVRIPALQTSAGRSNYPGVSGATLISNAAIVVSETRGTFGEDSSRNFTRDFKDGLSNTILVGERRFGSIESKTPWGDAIWIGIRDNTTAQGQALAIGDCAPTSPINAKIMTERTAVVKSISGFGSYHFGGTQFLLGDGSVRFISESIQPTVYANLATIDDGAVIADP